MSRNRRSSRSWWGPPRWYPPSPPKLPPPEHGIKVKQAGSTWWGQRWIAALEQVSAEYANRLARGRTYARAGRVHDMDIGPGTVRARVMGSRPVPYTVTIRVRPLPARTWTRALRLMARKAIFSAQLLAGEMPRDIDTVFSAAGRSLFPASREDLETSCSCPDWANPCKHVVATHYVLGEAFDGDPFLLFELRGRTREQILNAVRRLSSGTGAHREDAEAPGRPVSPPTVTPAPQDARPFDPPGGMPRGFSVQILAPAAHATILRQLGNPPPWSLRKSLVDFLAPAYQAAGDLARQWALDDPGAPTTEAPPRSRRPSASR